MEPHWRTNSEIEIAVTKGLATALANGWLAGAEQMRNNGVPFHVAARVLLYPKQRRSVDWSASVE